MTRSLSFRWLLLVLMAAVAREAAAEPPKVRNLRIDFSCEIGEVPAGRQDGRPVDSDPADERAADDQAG